MYVKDIPNKIWDKFLGPLAFLKHNLKGRKKNQLQYNVDYTAFSFFMTFIYMLSFFLEVDASITFYSWVLLIKAIGTLLCVGLLLEYYWPNWLKDRLYIYWNVTLFYCLPFAFTFFFLINRYNIEWIISISLAITLLLVLVNWLTFLVLSILGILLALVIYLQFIGPLPVLGLNNILLLVYSTTFSIAIGLIFVRQKEKKLNLLSLLNDQLTEVQQRNRQELAETLQYREQLLEELKPEEAAIFDKVITSYMKQAIYRMTDYMRLNVTIVTLDELQQALAEFYKCKLNGLDQAELLFKKVTKHSALQADLIQLKQLLINAINYVQQYNTNNNPITLAIEDAFLGHEIAHMPNYTRKLESLKITITTNADLSPTQPIYKIDPAKSSTWVPQKDDEFLLIENARIIDAHYGYMADKSMHTQVYILPVQLREIRGKVMELIKGPAAVVPEEINHPLAIQLEQELWEKLKNTSVDRDLIQRGLDIIKRYHGGVKRKSGEPFFTHPIAVALILLEYSHDQDAILGALLHDTVEDTSLSFAHIRMLFGERVEFLVAKATNLEDHNRRISLTDKENLARILNYEDPSAALIKLSDRLHNMRTIQYHSSLSKQRSIAQETLKHFVPLARELNLEKMAVELEQLSKAVLKNK